MTISYEEMCEINTIRRCIIRPVMSIAGSRTRKMRSWKFERVRILSSRRDLDPF